MRGISGVKLAIDIKDGINPLYVESDEEGGTGNVNMIVHMEIDTGGKHPVRWQSEKNYDTKKLAIDAVEIGIAMMAMFVFADETQRDVAAQEGAIEENKADKV